MDIEKVKYNGQEYSFTDTAMRSVSANFAQKSEIPSTDGFMQEWLLEYNDDGKISAYNGSQFVGGGSGPVDWADRAGTAENVQCNNGLINYEATGEDNTGFYVGNYLGNVEVRVADHDKGDIEQWYWDKSGIGCRETKNTWGYYSKLSKDDLQFTSDGGYTPSMSFKQLWDAVMPVTLFEGNVAFNNEIPLTESYKNFEKLVIVNGHNRECTLYTSGITNTPNQNGNALFWHTGDNVNADKFLTYLNYSSVNDTTLISTFGTHIRFKNDGTITITTNSSDYNTRTFKVIGIGRKA